MMNSKSHRLFGLGMTVIIFIVFMIVVYQNGILDSRNRYSDYVESQHFEFLLTQKSIITALTDHIGSEHQNDAQETEAIIGTIIESQWENSHLHAQFAILDQDGQFLFHPIYSGKNIAYIKDNYDAEVYQQVMAGDEGFIETPVNPYKPELSQVVYYTRLEPLNWRLMLIEDRTHYLLLEKYRNQLYVISATILCLIFGSLTFAFFRTIQTLNMIQETNVSLENMIEDRTIAVLTNNRELEYALKDAEASKERVIETNEELNLMIRQIQDTQEKLIESEKMASLGSIVAGVAHEINTPLGTALTSATYLEELIKETESEFASSQLTKRKFASFISDVRDTCQILTDSLFRTSQLVLSFKQIAVDQSDTQKLSFDLADYLHKIVLSLKHEYKNTPHNFKIHCADNLEINSYPGAYAQIFTNLIMNSLTHGFDTMIEGTITIDIKKIEHNLFIIYSDNGKGISKSDIKRIFEPFFTTKRGEGGSGLGMNIVYNLVTQKLGGTIQVKSERNNGVKFIMQIPV